MFAFALLKRLHAPSRIGSTSARGELSIRCREVPLSVTGVWYFMAPQAIMITRRWLAEVPQQHALGLCPSINDKLSSTLEINRSLDIFAFCSSSLEEVYIATYSDMGKEGACMGADLHLLFQR